jgi:hypothetical protein
VAEPVETAFFNANAFYYLDDLPAAPARYHVFAMVGDLVSNLQRMVVQTPQAVPWVPPVPPALARLEPAWPPEAIPPLSAGLPPNPALVLNPPPPCPPEALPPEGPCLRVLPPQPKQIMATQTKPLMVFIGAPRA